MPPTKFMFPNYIFPSFVFPNLVILNFMFARSSRPEAGLGARMGRFRNRLLRTGGRRGSPGVHGTSGVAQACEP